MPNIVITGAQWGDEGKGKIVDLLARKIQIVARYNGGHNAGHTVWIDGKRYVLHLVPSGILHPGVLCVMGNGMVIDPWALESEMAELRELGVEIDGNLKISDRAHLILPHHREVEALAEAARGDKAIGTTQRGIGPCYEDKAARRGVRMGDLRRPEALPDKLEPARRHYELLCRGAGKEPAVDWDALLVDLKGFGERLGSHVTDTALLLAREVSQGYSVLFEGAQATLLDVDYGTYPFVTSSTASVAGACVGTGVPPSRVDGALGIVKAYTTRVGAGPLPTEIGGAAEERLRERGREYGATTGRSRRCGWFDALVVRFSVALNGFDTLALMKLDVLDDLDEIPVCTGYRYRGETLSEFPADVTVLAECEPIYETLPGWKTPTGGARDFAGLPAAARGYVERLGELVGCEIGIVSTGPDRNETIIRGKSAIARWFD